jgi:hypothetical protein
MRWVWLILGKFDKAILDRRFLPRRFRGHEVNFHGAAYTVDLEALRGVLDRQA